MSHYVVCWRRGFPLSQRSFLLPCILAMWLVIAILEMWLLIDILAMWLQCLSCLLPCILAMWLLTVLPMYIHGIMAIWLRRYYWHSMLLIKIRSKSRRYCINMIMHTESVPCLSCVWPYRLSWCGSRVYLAFVIYPPSQSPAQALGISFSPFLFPSRFIEFPQLIVSSSFSARGVPHFLSKFPRYRRSQ